jgi:hypothetical protein
MYDKSDPRSALATDRAADRSFTSYTPADYLRFYASEPQDNTKLERTWFGRGQNAIVAYSEAKAGATFERKDQADEWALLLPDAETRVELVISGGRHSISGGTLTFVPPGHSTVSVVAGGRIVRVFTTVSKDLAERCVNASGYGDIHPNIPPLKPWPLPPGGLIVRTYRLDVPDEAGRFGRIWRCTTLMINYFAPSEGPRDNTKLSPHHHDDFEQYSLALSGAFIHHMRWAWTPNKTMWRPDEHELCATPSVAVIPPPAIHTTEAVDAGVNQLVDIFSPPRMDFSLKPGWVLNADDYPLP